MQYKWVNELGSSGNVFNKLSEQSRKFNELGSFDSVFNLLSEQSTKFNELGNHTSSRHAHELCKSCLALAIPLSRGVYSDLHKCRRDF